MKSGSPVILALAITVLAGCNRPSESDCKKAIANIRHLAGTESDEFGDPETAIRSCRGNGSKASVKCVMEAKVAADLEKCEGGVFEEMYKDAVETHADGDPAAKPADPAAKPGDPAAKPGDVDPPATPPGDPAVPAAGDPAAQPGDPAAKPGDPAAKPGDPAAKPGDPAAKPADPAAQPADPAPAAADLNPKDPPSTP